MPQVGSHNVDEKKILKKILKLIEDKPQIVQLCDIYSTGVCSKWWFQTHFPVGSEGYVKVIDALDENRMNMKAEIRDRLLNLNQAAALIALYKLIGTPEERTALSNIKVDSKKEESNSGQTITLTFG